MNRQNSINSTRDGAPPTEAAGRMPVGFVGHGAPTLAIDPGKGGDLKRWGEALPQPRAILVISV